MSHVLRFLGMFIFIGAGCVTGLTRLPSAHVVFSSGAEFRVEVASTLADRAHGLSGRKGLAPNEGMLFVFEHPGLYAFWMNEMQFPIDMIWVAEGRVVGIAESMPIPQPGIPPALYRPSIPIDRAIELSVGSVQMFGIHVGDEVMMR